jgi:hypothetical protein
LGARYLLSHFFFFFFFSSSSSSSSSELTPLQDFVAGTPSPPSDHFFGILNLRFPLFSRISGTLAGVAITLVRHSPSLPS